MRRLSATVSIDWLIKLCYQDGRRPARPAALRGTSCCGWVNKVMCSLNGCDTAGGVALWWQRYRRHFDCRSNRLEPNASQYDEEGPSENREFPICCVSVSQHVNLCVPYCCMSLQPLHRGQTEKPHIGRWEHKQHVLPQILTTMKKDVRYVGSVSGGTEEGGRLVRESGRGDRRSHYATPSFL